MMTIKHFSADFGYNHEEGGEVNLEIRVDRESAEALSYTDTNGLKQWLACEFMSDILGDKVTFDEIKLAFPEKFI